MPQHAEQPFSLTYEPIISASSRSTSDLLGVNCQRTPKTSSSHVLHRWWQGHHSPGENPSPRIVRQTLGGRASRRTRTRATKRQPNSPSCLVRLDTRFGHFSYTSGSNTVPKSARSNTL